MDGRSEIGSYRMSAKSKTLSTQSKRFQHFRQFPIEKWRARYKKLLGYGYLGYFRIELFARDLKWY